MKLAGSQVPDPTGLVSQGKEFGSYSNCARGSWMGMNREQYNLT